MATLIAFAPAKLNLFLHIVGRRADGYHRLQTIFQLIDYHDTLQFTLRNDPQIQLALVNPTEKTAQAIGAPEDNLIIRAARLLQKSSAITRGVNIILEKRIPIGAGLGGGSSDAATTLLALNQLWRLHLPNTILATLGLRLGADIPLFVLGKTAWGEEIGDQLTPLDLPPRWFVVMIPPCIISTQEIYAAEQLTRDTPPITIQDFLAGLATTYNAFEPVVRQRYPEVVFALQWLNQFAPARLTGTGACVFATFASREEAEAVAKQIPEPYKGFIAQSINEIEKPIGV